uniref:2-oxoglutarate and iron dependent oxygenase domain containing 3 n=1 Tax=Terrapene triunguis TaxID=2587831 RepID=A0A674JZE5_9SAUR
GACSEGRIYLCSVLSVRKSRAHQESRRKWLKVAFLVSSAVLVSLLSWSYLVSEDGVAEVLAHYSESLQDRFIEVPCSEDYDSHKRFEVITQAPASDTGCFQNHVL